MDEINFTIPTDFSTLSDEALTELHGQATAAAKPLVDLVNAGERLDEGQLATLERLGEVVTQVASTREGRIATAAAATAGTQRAAAAAAVFAADESTDADEDEDDEDAAKKKAKKKADKDEEDASVQASAARPGVAAVAKHAPRRGQTVEGTDERKSYTKALAAAGQANVQAGQEFATVMDIAKAVEDSFANFGNQGDGVYLKSPVVQFRREYPAEKRVTAADDAYAIMDKIDSAGKESSLEAGSLVAAAGWCAPSEILYDLFELENGTDGLLDLPEIQVSRGGFQFSPGPDFSTLWALTGYFHQTEAQVIAGTSKPCMPIACPAFTDIRLQVEGVCITGSFLQDRGYPELVARFVRGAMVAHRRKLNVFKINQVVAGSTAVNLTVAANFGGANSIENDDISAASRILHVLEAQATDYRYKHRMAENALLEAVLPMWVKGQIRADVQRRTGTSAEEAFRITDAMMEEWMRIRGVRPQWVYDWQDAFNGGGTVGGATAIGALPVAVDILLYAAGTWVAGVADVIRLDTVYDSTNLALNQYTQLFTEEGILVAKRGFESRRIQLNIPPAGVTSAAVVMTNAA
jgi:hypothetical protein